MRQWLLILPLPVDRFSNTSVEDVAVNALVALLFNNSAVCGVTALGTSVNLHYQISPSTGC